MKRILLVEDDKIVQHVHKLMLTKLGYNVDIADSGELALNFLADTQYYQFILVDIGLPDMSGFELIQKMKLLLTHSLKQTPIIALTGYVGESEKSTCLTFGAVEVLHKPILKNKMLEALERHSVYQAAD
ncbi:MAG: response regulator [Gammaproteobacteria bacterium]